MKTALPLFSAALVLILSACDSKPTATLPAAAPSAPQTTPAETVKPRDVPVSSAPIAQKPNPKPAGDNPKTEIKPATPPAEAKKTAAVEKSETEAGLASTVDHARTVTKTQESKARTRAQRAEDEMEEMMRAQKK